MDAEQELVEQAVAGNKEARERLFGDHLAGLRAYVRTRLGAALRKREESVDIAQSVVREALRDLDGFRFQGAGSFRRWLLVRAENKLRDRGRFWKRDKRAEDVEVDIEAVNTRGARLDAIETALLDLASPSRAAVAREELKRVEQAFAELPDDYRRVILLTRIAGLSHAEVALEIGRTETATRIVLSRALARLALLLERRKT